MSPFFSGSVGVCMYVHKDLYYELLFSNCSIILFAAGTGICLFFLTNQVNFSFYLIPVFPFSDSNFFIVIADTIFMVDFSTSIDKC